MTTRCQLRFQSLNDDPTDPTIAQLYRHSGGEPPQILHSLQQLQLLLRVTHTERAPGNAAAAFILMEGCRLMTHYLNPGIGPAINAKTPAEALDIRSWVGLEQPLFLMEYVIEDPTRRIHGDEAYLYVVELPSENGVPSTDDWYVRIAPLDRAAQSEPERAFEDARWEFDGPLGEAADLFGTDQRL